MDKHDAQYVEVIHTCGGYLGFAVPIGHVDFYPNGGSSQPGCGTDYRGITKQILNEKCSNDVILIFFAGFCAHNRAHRFFSESIISDIPFVAMRCENYNSVTSLGCKTTGQTLNMGGFNINYGYIGIFV